MFRDAYIYMCAALPQNALVHMSIAMRHKCLWIKLLLQLQPC